MELRQLEYLVAVADDASFTRAAARLHVAQPGISAQVKKLETELGEPLLDRSARTVVPTAVGAAVLEHAREALAAVERVRAAVAEHAGLLTGRVAIGVIGSGLPPELPDLLATFARAHPEVELTLTEGHDRLAALLDGRSDVAIVGIVGEPPPGVATEVLRDEPVVAAVAADDPLAGRAEITLAEAAARPLIALPPGTGLRAGVDAALDAQGLTPRIAYEAATPAVLGELAARGLGVALVPASVVPYVAGLVGIPLVEPALHGRVDLAWPARRPIGPAARALIAHLRSGPGPLASVHMGSERVDGRRVTYAEHGDPSGRVVFLLHGTPGCRLGHEFAHRPAAERGIRIVCPDRPGLGGSDPQPGRTSPGTPATSSGWPTRSASTASPCSATRAAARTPWPARPAADRASPRRA